jgi:hypothetical protein
VADNVTIPAAGTGDTTPRVSTDQLAGGEHVQYVKLMDGTLDGTGKVAGDATNGLDVDVTRVSGVVHVDDNASTLSVDDGAGSLTVDGTFWQATQPVSGTVTANAGTGPFPVSDNAGSLTVDAPVGTPVFVRLSDGAAALVGQKTMALSLPVAVASDQSVFPAVAEHRAATLHVTATAAVNTAVTLTLPAAGAGLFHYITSIQLVKLYAVVGTAAATGVIVTSTNLPGNPSWTTEQAAGGLGTAPVVISYQPTTPLKSSVANTATTLVAPLQAQTIWRWNVSYFTAA